MGRNYWNWKLIELWLFIELFIDRLNLDLIVFWFVNVVWEFWVIIDFNCIEIINIKIKIIVLIY